MRIHVRRVRVVRHPISTSPIDDVVHPVHVVQGLGAGLGFSQATFLRARRC